eukprot:snap_masked-scaffold_10-processed-gene-2.11-mRNA-1 protein AED:1.00 eAED:1.00 QI:0/0/0/0/1/1/4/0/86
MINDFIQRGCSLSNHEQNSILTKKNVNNVINNKRKTSAEESPLIFGFEEKHRFLSCLNLRGKRRKPLRRFPYLTIDNEYKIMLVMI